MGNTLLWAYRLKKELDMPWKVHSLMSSRKEFVLLARPGDNNIAELCRRAGISRKTGYKWINRYVAQGQTGLFDRPRTPSNSPTATPLEIQEAIFEIRQMHPAWGGRKIHALLLTLGLADAPAASTISNLLKRNGYIDPQESLKHKGWQRFEAPAANDLWQMDFKGHFEAANQRCHPLTVLDDHSRYSICLKACGDQRRERVRNALADTFRMYGLPRRILCDNGPPWGTSDRQNPYTRLALWLMRLGIEVVHSRSYHPQTLGKEERFHRTLKAELLNYCGNLDLDGCQARFDWWRTIYNTERPHEALDMAVPASRYSISPRRFPEKLPEIEYGPGDQVRKVQDKGRVSYLGQQYQIGKVFHGERVAIRPTRVDGLLDVLFCNQKIGSINLRVAGNDIERDRV
jgi:transposase InsO family protein